MTRTIPLIGPAFTEQTPETFKEYVTSLYEQPANTTPVPGVKICYGDKVTQVRFAKGKEKKVTKKDVKVLAEFYEKKETEILELFKKRKVVVV